MKFDRVAVWILGPAGSGKSTLGAPLAALGFRTIDQDRITEPEMRRQGIPLDTRVHTPDQARAFKLLREQVAERVWNDVKRKRATGRPLVYEATGNKPHYLEQEVIADRAAGYRVLALGLLTPLDVCRQRNAQRERVLPDELVESTWNDFRRGVEEGTYRRIFGPVAFDVAADSSLSIDGWLVQALREAR